MLMRRLIPLAALVLAGCNGRTPPPAIEVRTEIMKVPVPVACIKASDVPAMPPRVGDKLTGNAVLDADTLAASLLRARSALDQALALISSCTAAPSNPAP
jgi:hypothetical protein